MPASVIPSNQIRYNDPYTQRIFQYEAPAEQNKYYLAREVNNLLKLYGDRVFQGLTIQSSSVDSVTGDLTVTIEKGVVIVDSTLIFIEDDITVMYPSVTSLDLSNGFFAAFLNYQWLYTVDNNPLKITIYYVDSNTSIPEAGFDANRDRVFVGYITVDPNTLDTTNYTDENDYAIINNETYYVGNSAGTDPTPIETYMQRFSAGKANSDLSNVDDQTILEKLKNVDGEGSGLDADLFDGLNSNQFLRKDISQTPAEDNVIDLGSSTKRYANMYAVTFNGNATSANYADLAEKYTIEDLPKVGDVICISRTEEVDCEISNEIASQKVLGVVTEKPAFKMNDQLKNGIYVALKGRVKCKVYGKIEKGDPLVSYMNGAAISINNVDKKYNQNGVIFAKALQNKNTNGYGFIEVVVL